MYTKYRNFYPAGTSSSTTSPWYLVSDYASLSLEIGSASTVTIQGANSEGFATAVPEADASTLTLVASAGIYKIESGFRWLRTVRSQSTNTIMLSAVQRV